MNRYVLMKMYLGGGVYRSNEKAGTCQVVEQKSGLDYFSEFLFLP